MLRSRQTCKNFRQKNSYALYKNFIHLIWATKKRERLIFGELKSSLLHHIKENSRKTGIFIDTLNCVSDHIHLLISLGNEQSVAKTVMLIKGESSFWVNKQKLLPTKFEWQDEYIALSVSYSAVDKVRGYILNQESHHQKKSFSEEYDEFLTAHQFQADL